MQVDCDLMFLTLSDYLRFIQSVVRDLRVFDGILECIFEGILEGIL